MWHQKGITRDLEVTNNCFKLIFRIFHEPITYKQAQMAAGFLNYYSLFAGTAYVFGYKLLFNEPFDPSAL
jgi:hypothetical protein